jgi:hypothetical protein
MKKYTTYVRVTVDYEIECEVPDNLDQAQTDDLIESQGFDLISGNDFQFDISEFKRRKQNEHNRQKAIHKH